MSDKDKAYVLEDRVIYPEVLKYKIHVMTRSLENELEHLCQKKDAKVSELMAIVDQFRENVLAITVGTVNEAQQEKVTPSAGASSHKQTHSGN